MKKPRTRRNVILYVVLPVLAGILWGSAACPQERPSIIIGDDYDYAPFVFQGADGEYQGYNVDIAKAVTHAAGIKAGFRFTQWNEVKEALRKGEIDAAAGMCYTPERSREFDFTSPHVEAACDIFVRKNSPWKTLADMRGKEVFILKGDVAREQVASLGIADKLIEVSSVPEGIRRLAKGEGDGIVVGRYQGYYLADALGFNNLRALGFTVMTRQYCLAVRKGNAELLNRLNDGLRIIRASGEYARIYDKWFLVYEKRQVRHLILPLIWGGVAVTGFALAAFLWVFFLRRSVRRKTQALEESQAQWRALLDAIPDFMFRQDLDSRVLDYKAPGDVVLGLRRSDIVGKTLAELPLERATTDTLCEAIREATTTQTLQVIETRIENVNGQAHDYEIRVAPLSDHEVVSIVRDITARKRAEEELRATAARLHAVMESIPFDFWMMDADGRYSFQNESSRRLWGNQLGKRPEEVLTDPGLLARWQNNNQRAMSGESFAEEIVANVEGEERAYINVLSPIEDSGHILGILGVNMDITDRRNAEQALRESEERFMLALHGGDLGLWEYDLRKGIYTVDERSAAILGYEPRAIVREISDWILEVHPDDREALARAHRAHIAGDTDAFASEHRLRAHDGSWKWILSRGKVVARDSDGIPLRMLGTHLDITDRRLAEEERLQMEQQVQHAQKLESLGVLAGGIAHDFNNILMSILGNADLAQRELSFASPAQANLRDVIASARRAADLCKQMLAYSGKGRFSIEPVNLRSLVEDMGRMIEVSVSKRAVLKMDLPPGVPRVSGDPAQLRQVIMNLLTNASESLEEKSGIVSVSTGVMECSAAYLSETILGKGLPEGSYSYIEVSDTGCGMTEEVRARMFEPFFSTKFTGRGLGMAAVLGIVRGHNGAIRVDSLPGKGATIRVLFPATEVESEVEETVRRGPLDAWRPSGTILLVDDEETVRVIGHRMLKHIGFDVIMAENGLKAIELYQQHASKIVCIILDFAMPRMDGAETFRELQRQGVSVPVVLCSGYDEKEATDRFMSEGLSAFIQKPYEVNTLMGVLSQLINPVQQCQQNDCAPAPEDPKGSNL